MEKISFVIPVYNSENTISEIVYRIMASIEKLDETFKYQIVLVNDASVDSSFEKCRALSQKYSNVIFLSLSRNFGQHSAIMAGLGVADGDYVVCMDDDGQNPPEEFYKLLDNIRCGNYDVVFAKHLHHRESIFRRISSKANDIMASALIEKPKEVYMTSFFIMRKFVVDEILKYKGPFAYITGLIFRTTQNIGFVCIEHKERKFGKSNYSLLKLISLWANGFTSFSVKPLRVSSLVGVFLSGFGFLYIIVLIVQKIITPEISVGWTSLMAIVVFFGGIQLLSVGLLGEYIGRIFLSINNKPQYVVKYDSRDDFDMKGGD